MEPHFLEWLNLTVRWLHFVTGVAWIGASFYFNWLENNLERTNQRDEIAGSLWAVHGGGFYYIEKYKLSPQQMPPTLHWFKYEAYFTWISGLSLLAVVYYLSPSLYLIGGSRITLSPAAAISVSLGSLLVGWVAYDQLCKSPIGKNNLWTAAFGFAMATAMSFCFSQVFSPRAAFIHVGAVLGTCMVANVFRVIIPSQKALVEAAAKGIPPDPVLGKNAQRRSLHNNYMTLPVLFIMISNHFPSTYSQTFSWILLAGLALVGASVRHWFNLKGRGKYNVWILPIVALGMVALAFVTKAPTALTPSESTAVVKEKVTFAAAESIVKRRCVPCHSSHPTDDVFKVAPAGVMFDSPELIVTWAASMKQRAVTLENMPFGNKTGMTKGERQALGEWVDSGAALTP